MPLAVTPSWDKNQKNKKIAYIKADRETYRRIKHTNYQMVIEPGKAMMMMMKTLHALKNQIQNLCTAAGVYL